MQGGVFHHSLHLGCMVTPPTQSFTSLCCNCLFLTAKTRTKERRQTALGTMTH